MVKSCRPVNCMIRRKTNGQRRPRWFLQEQTIHAWYTTMKSTAQVVTMEARATGIFGKGLGLYIAFSSIFLMSYMYHLFMMLHLAYHKVLLVRLIKKRYMLHINSNYSQTRNGVQHRRGYFFRGSSMLNLKEADKITVNMIPFFPRLLDSELVKEYFYKYVK